MNRKLHDPSLDSTPPANPDGFSLTARLTSLLGLRPIASILVAVAAGYLIGRLQDEPE